jgi:hypothetical protein
MESDGLPAFMLPGGFLLNQQRLMAKQPLNFMIG